MKVPVLDHGYVELVETWGSDERIIESARMSTSKGFLGWERETYWVCPLCHYTLVNDLDPKVGHVIHCPSLNTTCKNLEFDKTRSHIGDKRLLRNLWKNKHTTPFEMAGMTIEVQAPIFVFREWHRHRTQSYSELSARYTPVPDVNYRPTQQRIIDGALATTNKQASGVAPLLVESIDDWLKAVDAAYDNLELTYQTGLKIGIPKELARIIMPVGRYSRMRASTDLWNWLHFLKLRLAPGAQLEIRQYAIEVGKLIEAKFPCTWELFAEKL